MITFKTDNTSKQCFPHRKRLCPVVQLLVDCFLFFVTAPISFDDPPQTETLNHLTANRAKVPQKRPPSKVLHIMSHSHKSLTHCLLHNLKLFLTMQLKKIISLLVFTVPYQAIPHWKGQQLKFQKKNISASGIP